MTMAPLATIRYQLVNRWRAQPGGSMVTIKTVDQYIATVRKEWQNENKILSEGTSYTEARRDHLRKALELQAFRAANRKVPKKKREKDKEGNIIEVTEMVVVPDEHTVSRAIRELIELDNLRVTPEIRITGAVGTAMSAGPDAYRELLASLRGERVAPKRQKASVLPEEPALGDPEANLNDEE